MSWIVFWMLLFYSYGSGSDGFNPILSYLPIWMFSSSVVTVQLFGEIDHLCVNEMLQI